MKQSQTSEQNKGKIKYFLYVYKLDKDSKLNMYKLN